MDKPPLVTIILVNWNGKADTLECLESLKKDTYAAKQIFVVDNGSQDDSVSAIRAAYPDVTVLAAGDNLGFTGGNNLGIRHAVSAGSDFVFLLNNDTTVEPAALTKLVETALSDPQYGLLSPVIHYHDAPSNVWFAGSSMDLSRGTAVHDNSRVPATTNNVSDIPWASGCAMLLPANVIERLAGFDERYFLNWEDVDLSLRVRAFGHKIGLVPGARIYHKVSRTLSKRSDTAHYYYVRNNLLLVSTHGGKTRGLASLRVTLTLLRNDLRDVANRRARALSMLGLTMRAVQHHCMRRYGRWDGVR